MALDSSQESPRSDARPLDGAPATRFAAPGVVVRARGSLWHIVGTTAGADCVALHVRRVGNTADEGPVDRTFLEPFERCVPLEATNHPRSASRQAWIRSLRTLLSSITRIDVPTGLEQADIALLPYQLEPAIALLRGEATRLLVADHVGLGKTIQTGIVIADLVARQQSSRVLIVTPAGLREQWDDELRHRIGVHGTVCDARWLAGEIARWPPGVNPWTPPGIRIVSVDFLKRPETLNALDGITWDLLVVDEAHAASAGSDRGTAVAAVARRSRRVLCTTATPHDGVQAGFDALCALGRHDPGDRLALFRRSRNVLERVAGRRSIVLRVEVSDAERRMHDLLAGYVRAATVAGLADPGARLAMVVLVKRALSSARALELTATRRRALLAGDATPEQAALPFADSGLDHGDDDVPDQALAKPALRNARHERAWLGAVIEAARHAARVEAKPTVLERLLRRAREPHLVFTEYRDTLRVLAQVLRAERVEVLHGGQSPDERRRALSAFVSGEARILLATDTASEGLNLHSRCRSVVLFDLPWTPTRSEQRIGRVDRIGQARRVHALSLVAGGTPDEWLVRRHDQRAAAIERALGGVEGTTAASTFTQLICERSCSKVPEQSLEPTAVVSGPNLASSEHTRPPLGAAASRAVEVIALVRAVASTRRTRTERRATGEPRPERRERPAPVITTLTLRQPLGGRESGLLVIARADVLSPFEASVETHVLPLVCEVHGPSARLRKRGGRLPRRQLREVVTHLLSRHDSQIRDAVEAALSARLAEVRAVATRCHELHARRAEAIARDQDRVLARALVQPSLFDEIPGAASGTRPPGGVPVAAGTSPSESRAGTVSLRIRVALAALFDQHPRAHARRA